MKPRIVVVGSANTDMVVQLPVLPRWGETLLGGQFFLAQGGKGANQAVAAARLGADVTFIARMGSDSFADQALSAYAAEGIQTTYIQRDPQAASGVALIMVSSSGENMIAVAPGANGLLSPRDVFAAQDVIAAADCLLLQLEIPLEAVQAAAELAHRHGVRVILNPAPARWLPPEILRHVSLLTPNEHEAATLMNIAPGEEVVPAAQNWVDNGELPAFVMTLGSKGAAILTKGQKPTYVPAFAVTAVDTVAAGDAFNGGLALALSRPGSAQGTADLAPAVRYANAVGALSCTRAGAQPSLPTRAEVEQFINSSETS